MSQEQYLRDLNMYSDVSQTALIWVHVYISFPHFEWLSAYFCVFVSFYRQKSCTSKTVCLSQTSGCSSGRHDLRMYAVSSLRSSEWVRATRHTSAHSIIISALLCPGSLTKWTIPTITPFSCSHMGAILRLQGKREKRQAIVLASVWQSLEAVARRICCVRKTFPLFGRVEVLWVVCTWTLMCPCPNGTGKLRPRWWDKVLLLRMHV